ncbi:PrsW family intramembrane metalloprotease [Halostella sp. JP-L12]|uniref:PrsW family intramembrane metalloprotease n=1 Tax=Halostella TaxID=1843185 RepID=UPI000EF8003A|nr:MULTISPECIES: PrsW family glutamic-type intramembrane protease [Halostella]NHN48200.1 PrsW family intramembrane metalloprotease [Halostella sp. JP-L12]
MSSGRDPVDRAADGSRDLYDVSDWEPRSAVDRLAVAVHGSIRPILRWILILLGVVILVALFALGSLGAVLDPYVGAFVLLSAVPALLLALYVWKADVTSGEPLDLLVATFVLAVLFAGFAGVLNDFGSVLQMIDFGVVGLGSILFFYLVVGPVEEIVKMLAVRLWAYRSPRFDSVLDGAVYGAVAGLGFATIENALYITRFMEDGGVFSIAFVRALAGPGHVVYSGIAGYYLGLAKFNQENAGPIAVKGILVAAFVHATYNVTVGIVPPLVADATALGQGAAFVGYIVLYVTLAGLYLFRKISRYKSVYNSVNAERDHQPAPERTEFES